MTAPAPLAPGRRGAELRWTHVEDLYVDGRWVAAESSARLPVVDPATDEEWGSVPDCSTADLDRAVAAARMAFTQGPWPRMSAAERAEVLVRMAAEIETRAEPLATTNTRENGSPVMESAGAAANAAGILRYFATLAPELDTDDVRPAPSGSHESLVRKDPLGVCALIAPWNFPINLVVIKLAPALLAGNTVVIKPAPSTPLSIRYVVDAAEAAGVPPGVVNLLTSGNDVADRLVRHPDVAKVAFTGSTPVGRRIAAACGELLRPVTLELGGKSSAVVLPDADLDQLRSVLLRTCLRNTGQTCYISTRILAPAERYEEVVDAVAATVAAAKVGDPFDADTVVGPVANRGQYDKVLGYLSTARAEGARVVAGGAPLPGPGNFVQPTVLADVTPEMTVAQEEIFGPVLTVLRYESLDEAVAIANNTPFGLGGVVFSTNPAAAAEVAERLDTGSVGINFFASNHAAPFAGRHDSGLGVEYGPEGLAAYVTYKSIHRRPTA
ncbi:aldehyde dehydrogenase family protein [Nocardioides sp. NPDC057767]|uniref:aldehyde dehydrogenase family protein n=1 Tax=unclassified Nocardioides TaxID=2615069 RepID=UPI003672E525